MAMAKQKKWIEPEWMKPYSKHLADTGGWMTPEDAINCDGKDCNFFANSVRAALCCAVAAQTKLLLRLHDQGLLAPPPEATNG
jgi:hypothetical protein